jgi:hypothetical protein
MMIVVRFSINRSRASWISLSDGASRFDVDSSSTNIGAFFKNARAMAIRCFLATGKFHPALTDLRLKLLRQSYVILFEIFGFQ